MHLIVYIYNVFITYGRYFRFGSEIGGSARRGIDVVNVDVVEIGVCFIHGVEALSRVLTGVRREVALLLDCGH